MTSRPASAGFCVAPDGMRAKPSILSRRLRNAPATINLRTAYKPRAIIGCTTKKPGKVAVCPR